MAAAEWCLLTTLPDLPSAQSLASILTAEGISTRVSSEAGVLGQAAPSRIYVDAAQLQRARRWLSERQFTEEELAALSAAAPPSER